MLGGGVLGGEAPKTYAKFSASRTNASMTISNGGLTLSSVDGWMTAILDMDVPNDKIVSLELSYSSTTIYNRVGMATSLSTANYGQTGDSVLGSHTNSGIVYSNGSIVGYQLIEQLSIPTVPYPPQESYVGIPTLVIFDGANRRIGFRTYTDVGNFPTLRGTTVYWTTVPNAVTTFYAIFSTYGTNTFTINTGQTPFIDRNKTLLATVSGAIEGWYTQ